MPASVSGPPRLKPCVRFALAGTAVLLVARLLRVPPFIDAASGAPLAEAGARLPWGHLLLTPAAATADWLICQSARQHLAFLVWLAAGYLLWRATRKGASPRREAICAAAAVGGTAAFILAASFLPRHGSFPVFPDQDVLLVDIHSHSSASWDGRRGFTPERNRRWHARMGFDAFFLTDHNTAAGLEECGKPAAPACLPGQELSLHGAHVLVLGNHTPVPVEKYQNGLKGLEEFLKKSGHTYGGTTVMSLPEYWRHHWERLGDLIAWGAQGFELVSASPKALDFPPEKRRELASLCRRRDLFMGGGTDNHGWAGAACVWSALKVPGWRSLDVPGLRRAVLRALSAGGGSSIRVVIRARAEPAPGAAIWLDPPRGLWALLRALTDAQRLSCLAWLWLPCLVAAARARIGL